MGNDGGSIPYRIDLVKTKAKEEKTDEKALARQLWLLCALSHRPLGQPVVTDALGKLYNKDAVIEYLLDRSTYGDGDQICGHVKGVKVGHLCRMKRKDNQCVDSIGHTGPHGFEPNTQPNIYVVIFRGARKVVNEQGSRPKCPFPFHLPAYHEGDDWDIAVWGHQVVWMRLERTRHQGCYPVVSIWI